MAESGSSTAGSAAGTARSLSDERDRARRLLAELNAEEKRISEIAAPSHNGITLPKLEEAQTTLDGWTERIAQHGSMGLMHAMDTDPGHIDREKLAQAMATAEGGGSSSLPPVRGAVRPPPNPPSVASSARSGGGGHRPHPGHQRGGQAGTARPAGASSTMARSRSMPAGGASRHPSATASASAAPGGPEAPGVSMADPLLTLRECIKALLADPAKYGSVHRCLESEYQYVIQLYSDATTAAATAAADKGRSGKGASRKGQQGSQDLAVSENWFDVRLRKHAFAGNDGDAGVTDPAGTDGGGGGSSSVSVLAREITQLRRLLATAESTRDHFKAQLTRASQDLDAREDAIAELEKHVDQAERTELELKKQNAHLMQETHRLKGELLSLEESRKRDNNLKRKLETQAERRLADAKTEISGLYTQLKVLTHRHQILERELGSTADDRDTFEGRFLTATKEADDAYDAVDVRNERITSLLSDIDNLLLRQTNLENAVRDLLLFVGRGTVQQLLTNPIEEDVETVVDGLVNSAAADRAASLRQAHALQQNPQGSSSRLSSPLSPTRLGVGGAQLSGTVGPSGAQLSGTVGPSGASEPTKDEEPFDESAVTDTVRRAVQKLLHVARAPRETTPRYVVLSSATVWKFAEELHSTRRRMLTAPHPAAVAASFMWALYGTSGRLVLATDQTMRSMQAAITAMAHDDARGVHLRTLDDATVLRGSSGEWWLAGLQSLAALILRSTSNQQRALANFARAASAADPKAGRSDSPKSGDVDTSALPSTSKEAFVPANAWRSLVPVSFGPTIFAAAPAALVTLDPASPPKGGQLIAPTSARPAALSSLRPPTRAHPTLASVIVPPLDEGNEAKIDADASDSPRPPNHPATQSPATAAASIAAESSDATMANRDSRGTSRSATPSHGGPLAQTGAAVGSTATKVPVPLRERLQRFAVDTAPDPASWRWAHVAKACMLKPRVTVDDVLRLGAVEVLFPSPTTISDPLRAKPYSGLLLEKAVEEHRMKHARLSPVELSRFVSSALAQRYAEFVHLEARECVDGIYRGDGGMQAAYMSADSPLGLSERRISSLNQASVQRRSVFGASFDVTSPTNGAGPRFASSQGGAERPPTAPDAADEPLLPFVNGLEPFAVFLRRFAASQGATTAPEPHCNRGAAPTGAAMTPRQAAEADARAFLGVSRSTVVVSNRPPPAPSGPGSRSQPPPEQPTAAGDAAPLAATALDMLGTVTTQVAEITTAAVGTPPDADMQLFTLLSRGLIPEQLFIDIFFNLDLLYATCMEACNHVNLEAHRRAASSFAADPNSEKVTTHARTTLDAAAFNGILAQQGFLVTLRRGAHVSAQLPQQKPRGKASRNFDERPPLPSRRRLPLSSLELARLLAALARDHGGTLSSVAVEFLLFKPAPAGGTGRDGGITSDGPCAESPRSSFYHEFVLLMLERFERDRRDLIEAVFLDPKSAVPSAAAGDRGGSVPSTSLTPQPESVSPASLALGATPRSRALEQSDWSSVRDVRVSLVHVKNAWLTRGGDALSASDVEQLLYAMSRPLTLPHMDTIVPPDDGDQVDASAAHTLAVFGYSRDEIAAATTTRNSVATADHALRKKSAGKKKGGGERRDGVSVDPKAPTELPPKQLAEVVGRSWPCARAPAVPTLHQLLAARHDEWFDLIAVDAAASASTLPCAVPVTPATVADDAPPSHVSHRQRLSPVDIMDSYHRFDGALKQIATFSSSAGRAAAAATDGLEASLRDGPESPLARPPGQPGAGGPAAVAFSSMEGSALPAPPAGAHYDEFAYYLLPRTGSLHTMLHRLSKLYTGVFKFDSIGGADNDVHASSATIAKVLADARRNQEVGHRGKQPIWHGLGSNGAGGAASPTSPGTAASPTAKAPTGQSGAAQVQTAIATAMAEQGLPGAAAAVAAVQRAEMFVARRVVALEPQLEGAFQNLLRVPEERQHSAVHGTHDGTAQEPKKPEAPTFQLKSRQAPGQPEGAGSKPRPEPLHGVVAAASGEEKPRKPEPPRVQLAAFERIGAPETALSAVPHFRPLVEADDVTALRGVERALCLSTYASSNPAEWRAYALRCVLERETAANTLAPHAGLLQFLSTHGVVGGARDTRRRSTKFGAKASSLMGALQSKMKDAAIGGALDIPDPAAVTGSLSQQLTLRAEYVLQVAPLTLRPPPSVESLMALQRVRQSASEPFPSAHAAYAAATGGRSDQAEGRSTGSNTGLNRSASFTGGTTFDSGTSGPASVFRGTLPKEWL